MISNQAPQNIFTSFLENNDWILLHLLLSGEDSLDKYSHSSAECKLLVSPV